MIPKLKTTLIAAALATWGIYHFFMNMPIIPRV